ncbi:MAG: alpha/beta fold hydrolase [Anaerolineae bacterium]
MVHTEPGIESLQMIKELELGKVHLVGASYGGAIVLNLPVRYPELVNKVVSFHGNAG